MSSKKILYKINSQKESLKHKNHENNLNIFFSLIFANIVAYIYLVEEFALLNECLDCQMEKSSSFCDDYLLWKQQYFKCTYLLLSLDEKIVSTPTELINHFPGFLRSLKNKSIINQQRFLEPWFDFLRELDTTFPF